MSKRIFNKEQIKSLLRNPNISHCSEKSISYKKDFKILAIKEWRKGLPAQEIFRQAGFNTNIIGKKTPKECLFRWRKIYNERAKAGLENDGRGKSKSGGRPKIKWKNDQDKIKYLETEVAYLKAENDFLVALRKKR